MAADVISRELYQRPALELAVALLGCELVCVDSDGMAAAGRIVETEAYRQDDEASHSFRGQTQRNQVMFGEGGHAYVYFTYGMHYCFNIVAGKAEFAEAVLIRALEPTLGTELMRQRRGTSDTYNLCSGPAKLVQALGITAADNGRDLTSRRLHLRVRPAEWRQSIWHGPRIGIRQAVDKPWRFFVANNPYVTKHKFNALSLPWEE